MAEHGFELILMACLLVCSAFFAAAEAALFSLTREHIRRLESRGGLVASSVASLLTSRTNLLVSILFGSTAVSVLYFATSFKVAVDKGHESPVAGAVFGVVSFLALVLLGDVAPKGVAVQRPVSTAMLTALPMKLFHTLVWPIRTMLTPLSRKITRLLPQRRDDRTYVSADELKMLVEMSHEQGMLQADTRHMINRVVGLGNRLVKEVQVPRVDVVFFDVTRSNEEFIELVRRSRHTRFPAYEGTRDNIVGVIHACDVFFQPGKPMREIVRSVPIVPQTKTIESLLHEFRDMGRHTAMVVDEHGGTTGMITLEDILEEVVGEIRDEFEPREPVIRMVGPDTYQLPGNLSTRAWLDMFGVNISSPDFDTLGGFVVSLLGRVPREGDSVSYLGLDFTVESVHGHRIRRLRVHAPNWQGEPVEMPDE